MKKKKTSPPAGDKADSSAGSEGKGKGKEVKAAVAGAKQVEKDKIAMPPPAVTKATTAA